MLLLSDCKSELAAAVTLGYTERVWDNDSGRELQPWSSIKYWSSLTDNERNAVELFGFTQITWDKESEAELPPRLTNKRWAKLTACVNGTSSDRSVFIG